MKRLKTQKKNKSTHPGGISGQKTEKEMKITEYVRIKYGKVSKKKQAEIIETLTYEEIQNHFREIEEARIKYLKSYTYPEKDFRRVSDIYEPGTGDHRAQYEMLLDDGLTCLNCVFCARCCIVFGSNENNTKCQFHPNRFIENKVNNGNQKIK